MSKGEIARLYSQLDRSDQRAFKAWLTNAAVVSGLFALALAAIAWAGSITAQGQTAVQQAQRSTEVSAAGAIRPAVNSPHAAR